MSDADKSVPKNGKKRFFKKRSPYHKMAKIKRIMTDPSGNQNISYRPFVTGAKGQSHEDILARASHDGFDYGTDGVDFHRGQSPDGKQNEIHGGPKDKCIRGCLGTSSLPKPKFGVEHSNNYILATPAIDTRQEDGIPSIDQLRFFTLVHIREVQHLMMKVIQDMVSDVLTHDWTKLDDTEMFQNNFTEAKDGKNFRDGKWWSKHRKNERHHPFDFTGEHKPTLVDILHMLCDWIAAGNARGFKGVSIEDSLKRVGTKLDVKQFLYDAFVNSFEELNSNIVVERGYQMSESEKTDIDNQVVPKTSNETEIIETEPSKEFLVESAAANAIDDKVKAELQSNERRTV